MSQEMKDIQREATEPFAKRQDKCRMCKSQNLEDYLDLGQTAPADQFRKKEELDIPEISYPLRVAVCIECGLSQLTHVVDPKILYQFDYPYESSTTATGKRHWDEFAEAVVSRLQLEKRSLIVDVGSNDGTLLRSFKDIGMNVAGIDPAPNIVAIANGKGIPTICDFFSMESATQVKAEYGEASVIVGTNVFAHIDDLDTVFTASQKLLGPGGVFIFESPYFGNLVTHLEYDTIYHEHLSYLSLTPVTAFVKQFGMEVFAVEETNIHGGSFRVYIGGIGERAIDQSVTDMLSSEVESKLHEIDTLNEFAKRVQQNRKELMTLLEKLLAEGKKIAVMSTPAKGMTLLNYCGITNRHMVFATEKSPLKIGRYTPGGRIPIVADEVLLSENVDFVLLLAWNFAREIMANNQEFAQKGGKFIIPIPKPTII